MTQETMLTHDLFAPLVGTGFAVGADDHADVLTLTEAELLRYQSPDAARPGFALVFTAERTDIMYEQQMLELTHPALGTIAMMTTPIGPDTADRMRYEAVFN